MNINLQQIGVCTDQSKPCAQIYLQIIASCINLQLPIVILKKNDYFKHVSSYNVHVYQFSGNSG